MHPASHCPCGSQQPYSHCCGRLHSGAMCAENAEQLMRSRYTAYVLQNWDYLHRSWHSSTRPERSELAGGPQLKWLELRIVATVPGDSEAFVEFVARYKLTGKQNNGHAGQLHERSRFVRENAQWVYIDGYIF